jgi:hypothetical protein
MARDEAPPFARGETWYGVGPSGTVPITTGTGGLGDLGLGGVNMEGREFVFEANSPDIYTGGYSNASTDPNGRPIRVKVVRNTSGANLKPGRLVHYDEGNDGDADTGQTTRKLETGVDGYCYQLADAPAGVVDEFLPAAGVVANDLFFIVIDGPTLFTNQHSAPITTAVGSNLVPAATGSSRTDDLAGRVALQDLTGTAATLANNIMNKAGKAEVANSTADALVAGVTHRLTR